MTVKETLKQYNSYYPVRKTTIRVMSGRQQIMYEGSRWKIPRQISRQAVSARVRFGDEVLLWITTKGN